jgi:hypothetical protein
MAENNSSRDRFDWRLPLCAAIGALVLFAPIMFSGGDVVVGGLLYMFVAFPSISLISLIVALRKKGLRRLAVLSMLVVYLTVSWVLFMNSYELRTTARWLIWSKNYKANVLAQPDSTNGTLRHIEWDGWGYPGSGNTVVYLVFDPNESLSTAASSHSAGKFGGIPCEVSLVRRWRAITTPPCFTPTPIGATANRAEN